MDRGAYVICISEVIDISPGILVANIYTHACMLSHVQLLATLWTVACWTPLSMGLSQQEYWS